jgi:hypothetical protein
MLLSDDAFHHVVLGNDRRIAATRRGVPSAHRDASRAARRATEDSLEQSVDTAQQRGNQRWTTWPATCSALTAIRHWTKLMVTATSAMVTQSAMVTHMSYTTRLGRLRRRDHSNHGTNTHHKCHCLTEHFLPSFLACREKRSLLRVARPRDSFDRNYRTVRTVSTRSFFSIVKLNAHIANCSLNLCNQVILNSTKYRCSGSEVRLGRAKKQPRLRLLFVF